MVKCLICDRPTESTHLGIDACHACTVFYRRNRIREGELECATGNHNCMDNKKTMISCRKCRLDRFKSVMRAGREENTSFLLAAAQDKQALSAEIAKQLIKPNSIIESIRINRGAISKYRRNEELKRRGIFISEADAIEEKYEIIPCTSHFMDEGMNILLMGIIKYIPNIFPEFRTLTKLDKALLIRSYLQMFHITFGSYTTFFSAAYADYFFSDIPDQTSAMIAARTFRENVQENITRTQKRIYRINPTEEEWLALIGLAFWSVENIEASEQLLTLASHYRTAIIAELSDNYRLTIGKERGATRIGDLLCILQDAKRAEGNLKSEYKIYRMLDVFDEDTLMYKMQVHRLTENAAITQ